MSLPLLGVGSRPQTGQARWPSQVLTLSTKVGTGFNPRPFRLILGSPFRNLPRSDLLGTSWVISWITPWWRPWSMPLSVQDDPGLRASSSLGASKEVPLETVFIGPPASDPLWASSRIRRAWRL